MGHVGLTPQTATALGGHRAQGRTAQRAIAVARDALALQDAGCFSVVLEAVPAPVAAVITELLDVPAIGIGAGPDTDGQVLVFHDLLGLYDGHVPRFVRRFAELRAPMTAGVAGYAEAVRNREFPGPEHGYPISDEELGTFKKLLHGEG
jgi:3-methyl-2-oxobutanoate hydroxymethyltransferase